MRCDAAIENVYLVIFLFVACTIESLTASIDERCQNATQLVPGQRRLLNVSLSAAIQRGLYAVDLVSQIFFEVF